MPLKLKVNLWLFKLKSTLKEKAIESSKKKLLLIRGWYNTSSLNIRKKSLCPRHAVQRDDSLSRHAA
jgi:hypothetical protein